MKLLVDIGNSRIKWATQMQAEISPGISFNWKPGPMPSPEEAFARHWGTLSGITGVWVVNVAGGDIGERLSNWCSDAWGVTLRSVHSAAESYGIINSYRDPTQLGSDRFVAMVGARREHDGAFCVIDCGTALTVDAVNECGEFLGGVIAPGLDLMRQALCHGTHALGYGEGDASLIFPRDTRSAIAVGTLHALAGCIEHAVASFRPELGSEPLCLLTGGEAALVSRQLAIRYRYEPHLVLKGLAAMAEETA